MLVYMDESTHEEHLIQPPQTHFKHFKKAVTILTGYNGFSKVTNKNNEIYFAKSNIDKDGFIQTTVNQGSRQGKSFNDEIKRVIIDEGLLTEADYPFTIKPNVST